jgi:hypothetical protein
MLILLLLTSVASRTVPWKNVLNLHPIFGKPCQRKGSSTWWAMATRMNRSVIFLQFVGSEPGSIQTERMFDIADVPFSQVSDDEKQKYVATPKQTGSYQGYKLREYWVDASKFLRPLIRLRS